MQVRLIRRYVVKPPVSVAKRLVNIRASTTTRQRYGNPLARESRRLLTNLRLSPEIVIVRARSCACVSTMSTYVHRRRVKKLRNTVLLSNPSKRTWRAGDEEASLDRRPRPRGDTISVSTRAYVSPLRVYETGAERHEEDASSFSRDGAIHDLSLECRRQQ